MKLYDGQITSSPGRTPAASNAKCKPVVQLFTAMACRAPTNSATIDSKRSTILPCASQPDATTSAAAFASASPTLNLVMGIIHTSVSTTAGRIDTPACSSPARCGNDGSRRYVPQLMPRSRSLAERIGSWIGQLIAIAGSSQASTRSAVGEWKFEHLY